MSVLSHKREVLRVCPSCDQEAGHCRSEEADLGWHRLQDWVMGLLGAMVKDTLPSSS